MNHSGNSGYENCADHLIGTAKKNPGRFEFEWERQVWSWLNVIRRDAYRLRDRNDESVEPVFHLVDWALDILEACGEDYLHRYGSITREVLNTECSRHVARAFDHRLCRL